MIKRISGPLCSVLLGLVLGCGPGNTDAKPKLTFIQYELAQRLAEDTRTDSFTLEVDRGRVLGDTTAKLWVVMVSDFQCQSCRQWFEEVFPALRTEYAATGKVRIAFVNLPLANHLNAQAAAIVAGCASTQGRFWDASARIFGTQDRWKDLPDARPFLDSLAILAGADAKTQRSCSDQAKPLRLIGLDRERAKAAGVDSVPTFLIGRHRLSGDATLATFRAVIDSALVGR